MAPDFAEIQQAILGQFPPNTTVQYLGLGLGTGEGMWLVELPRISGYINVTNPLASLSQMIQQANVLRVEMGRQLSELRL